MIKASGIYKSFGNVEVLKGIDFSADEGEIISIIGASGAGKTTLLQILGSLLQADKGTILYDDTDITRLNDKKLSRFRNRHIGFVFQFHHLLPEFTALENVCIPALIAKNSRAEAEKKALELMEFLKVSHRLHHKPSALSGGEQQRVAVARALINNPQVVLADEPSGNLDTENKQELHQLFLKLRETFRQTFIIVTHDNELAHMADRMLAMKDGRFITT